MTTTAWPTPATNPDAFERLPGLFRRWEMPQVLETGRDKFLSQDHHISIQGKQLANFPMLRYWGYIATTY